MFPGLRDATLTDSWVKVRHIQLHGMLTVNILLAWVFPVVVYENDTKKPAFEVTTETSWKDFKDQVFARLDAVDVHLNYWIIADSCAWLDLICEADLAVAMVCVEKKALVARTHVVTMEVKNVVSNGLFSTKKVLTWLQLQKLKVREGKKEKHTHQDDIPPEAPTEMKRQLAHLVDLQTRRQCAIHSKPGLRVYCWIEVGKEGVEGGHREMTHAQLTLWAKYIVSPKQIESVTKTLMEHPGKRLGDNSSPTKRQAT